MGGKRLGKLEFVQQVFHDEKELHQVFELRAGRKIRMVDPSGQESLLSGVNTHQGCPIGVTADSVLHRLITSLPLG